MDHEQSRPSTHVCSLRVLVGLLQTIVCSTAKKLYLGRVFAFNRRGVAVHVCHDIASMGSHGDLVLQLIDWLWIRLFLYAHSTAVPKLTKLAILALLQSVIRIVICSGRSLHCFDSLPLE